MEGSTNSYLKALSYLFKKFLKSYILRRVITSIASDYHDHAKISRQVICQGKSKIILLSRNCFGKNKAEVVWVLLQNLSNHFCKSYRNIHLQIFINLCVLCVSVCLCFFMPSFTNRGQDALSSVWKIDRADFTVLYLLKVNNTNTRTRYEICSKSNNQTISSKTGVLKHDRGYGV